MVKAKRTVDVADAVSAIKTAILQSQYQAASYTNAVQLSLYYGIGRYVSQKSRKCKWGSGAIASISERLRMELPGLRGFSERNIKNMRIFYEQWKCLCGNSADVSAELTADKSADASADSDGTDKIDTKPLVLQSRLDNCKVSMETFFRVGFSSHIAILTAIKTVQERVFYLDYAVRNRLSYDALCAALKRDEFHHQGALANNFKRTLSAPAQALKAISSFKDEYLLDFINVEELGARDAADVDERVVENAIVHNIRNFIMKFGRDFAFVGNQCCLEAFGVEHFPDLVFFNRELNALVIIELKTGAFKPAYLGQLTTYLRLADDKLRKPHENPSIGLVLCKSARKEYVEYVIQDYSKPMGVATYKTVDEMPEKFRKALPDIEALRAELGRGNE